MDPELRPVDGGEGVIWTVGHWTYPEADFVAQLAAQRIDLVADVRAHPGSRRSPQFGRGVMPSWLARAGIDYTHLEDLGGRRRTQDVEPGINAGWENASFKNYADYTLSDGYGHGIGALTDLAAEHRVVIMCSEPTPWRCHRLLISNTLTARGWTVRHVIGASPPRAHELGQWGAAAVVDATGTVTYPAAG